MPQILTPERMPDAVIATMKKINSGKWIGEMTDLREYALFNNFCKEKKEQISSGSGIKVRYVMDHNHSAKHVGLYGTTNFEKTDAMKEGSVGWCYTDGNMIFDEREEAMNSGPEQVVDAVKVEQDRMITSVLELTEADVAGCPKDPSDNSTPFGIKFWLQRNATLGFNGGDPVGFPAGRGGVSSAAFPRHKNFTGKYTSYSSSDEGGLLYMMDMASDQTRWIAPTPEPGMGRTGYSRAIYCNWKTKHDMGEEAKKNNDSLGFDLASKEPVFRGAKFTSVPLFDDDSTNPVYMVDHNHFYAKFLKDWWMKRIKINRLSNQPHCFAVIVSMVWNMVCDDLRRHAVFYK